MSAPRSEGCHFPTSAAVAIGQSSGSLLPQKVSWVSALISGGSPMRRAGCKCCHGMSLCLLPSTCLEQARAGHDQRCNGEVSGASQQGHLLQSALPRSRSFWASLAPPVAWCITMAWCSAGTSPSALCRTYVSTAESLPKEVLMAAAARVRALMPCSATSVRKFWKGVWRREIGSSECAHTESGV